MAESPAEPSPDDAARDELSKRIQAYFDSPQGRENFLQGFSQASTPFLSVEEFRKRESRSSHEWYGLQNSQGQLHQGSTAGKKKLKGGHHNPIQGDWGLPQKNVFGGKSCKIDGHEWQALPALFAFVCAKCGVERTVKDGAVQYTAPTNPRFEDELDPGEDWVRTAEDDAEEATRICIWCGKVCESLEALDLHEEECEPT